MSKALKTALIRHLVLIAVGIVLILGGAYISFRGERASLRRGGQQAG